MHGCWLSHSPAFAFNNFIAEVEVQMLKETGAWQKTLASCFEDVQCDSKMKNPTAMKDANFLRNCFISNKIKLNYCQ